MSTRPMATLARLTVAGALLAAALGTGGASIVTAQDDEDCSAIAGREMQIPDTVEGKFNVAMVLIGPHNDGGWSQAHFEGLQYVCENVDGVHVAYIENVPEGADSEQVFRSLARKGFDFIIGTSFGYMDPMEIVAEDFPDSTFLHLTGYKSNGTNFGNFFGAIEDFKYLAGMLAGLAGQARRQPEDRLHGHLPHPGGDPPRQRHHAGRQADLSGVHDGHPLDRTPGTTRRWSAKALPRSSMPAPRSSSPARTRRPSPRSPRRRASGASRYDHPGSCASDACLTAPYWIWGPEYARIARAGQGRHLRRRLRVLRCRLRCHGPLRLHGGRDTPARRPRPARGRCPARAGHAGQDAGRRVRPLRRLRWTDHRQPGQRRPGRG